MLLALVAFATWPDPIAHDVVPYETAGLTHGPMLGQPTANSIRVWVRTNTPGSFRVHVSERLPPVGDGARVFQGQTLAGADSTGFVTLDELEPSTRYYYAVETDAGIADLRPDPEDDWPSFVTLPSKASQADPLNNPDGKFNLRFSIGCCVRQLAQSERSESMMDPRVPAFRTLRKQHVGTADATAFHIVHGDFIYEEEDDADQRTPARAMYTPRQNGTAAGLANNYKLYLHRGRYLAETLRYVPLVATFNDHEAGSNLDGAGEVGLGNGSHLYRDRSLAMWQTYLGWANPPSPHRQPLRFGRGRVVDGNLNDPKGDFETLDLDAVSTLHIGPTLAGENVPAADRGGENVGVYAVAAVEDGQTLKLDRPLRGTEPNADVPYSIGTHHYFDHRIGNCHFFYLDTRGERTKWKGTAHVRSEDRFILGETQRRWLLDTAHASDAEFLFLISPDPWTIYHSAFHVRPEKGAASKGDGFAGHVHERELILDSLDEIEKPVLIFTGDVHNSLSVRVTDNIWELMAGPMNSAGHPLGTLGLPPLCGPFDSAGRTVQLRWVGGYPDNVSYKRLRNVWYAVVQVNNVMTSSRPSGRGLQHVAYDEPQVVVRWHDGLTGALAYAESISTMDAKPPEPPGPKRSRWLPDLRAD